MIKAKMPDNEADRLDALRRYHVLDTPAEQAYDDITQTAAYIAQAPIAFISLVDDDRLWFKSKVGATKSEIPRDYTFCSHAIVAPGTVHGEPFVVTDATKDKRFAGNRNVAKKSRIRFYAAAPLITAEHLALGTLCVLDRVPRELDAAQLKALAALSRQVVTQLELRRASADLRRAMTEREVYLDQLENYQRRLENTNAMLKRESRIDNLTGLGNRTSLEERLAEELYRSIRYKTSLSLLMIDVDHFKKYNDDYGSPAGDAALEAVAYTLRDNTRACDFCGRYGGEEFAAVLPHTTREGALILAERIRDAMERNTLRRSVTISIGITNIDGQFATDPDTMLSTVEKALNAAKQMGRNQIRFIGIDNPKIIRFRR